MAKREKQRKRRAGRSLNLILWFAFSAFAVLLVLLYAVVQSALVTRQYYEKTVARITEAGEAIAREIASAADGDAAGARMFEAANDYGVSALLLEEDGASVFSPFGSERKYEDLASAARAELGEGDEPVFLVSEDRIVYAASAEYGGEACILCVLSALEPVNALASGRVWLSVIAALFAAVLAFAASGIISRLITKPVTEVTDRAKELARGNYRLDFKKDYYCSEIGELSEALERARAEISKADTMRRELIANVSHDFKTPLTMIKGYASMIREISGDDPEKRNAHAQVIIDEADRLSVLVGDLLELSRAQAGVGREKTVFNLSEEVYRVAARFSYLEEAQGYRIRVEAEEDLYVFADRSGIEQALYNLIGNAVDYTGEDKRVRVRLFRKDGGARFEVIDTGKGIPADEAENIWERYYRSSRTHRRPSGGSGLGLSIVKSILMEQNCPFGVISEVGKGSCFWIEFPPPPEDGSEGKKE